jgi:hypothetical protein
MTESVSAPPASYKDRSSALVGVGVLVVGLGGVSLLFAAVLAVAGLLAPTGAIGARPTQLLVTILIYIIVAVALVWLGIGAIRARRWARPLLLIVSWLWLLSGIAGVAVVAWVMPAALNQAEPSGDAMPPGCAGALVVATVVVMALFFVVLPGLLVLFFRSQNVKATCEARDPVPGWTDACPMPVLGLSLALWVCAAFMLIMILPYRGLFPFFGRFASGIPGAALTVGTAALTAYCAGALYRLDLRGWWVLFVASTVGAVSATLTLARTDLLEVYRLMGYSAEELAQLQAVVTPFGRAVVPLIVANGLVWFGYLLYMRKYFKPQRPE